MTPPQTNTGTRRSPSGKISALLNPAIAVIANLAIVAIIWFGGVKVDAGGLSQGEIIALVNYMMQIMLAMVVVANLVVIFTRASASAARVNEIFELQSSVTDPQSPTPRRSPARLRWRLSR